MNGEIEFINRINEFVEKEYLPDRYTYTEVKRIRFSEGRDLDWRTKLDRDPEFLNDLIRDGEKQAKSFLENL